VGEHPTVALGVQAARRGYRVAFATAHQTGWSTTPRSSPSKGDNYRLKGRRKEVATTETS
jgi:hypothetical protein